MPNAADIQFGTDASFLLVGDSGTKKTSFLGTLPSPIYIFDTDKGLAPLAGRSDIWFDTFRELPKGQSLVKGGRFSGEGWYEWGTAWPHFLKKLNEIGRSIDDGTCKFKSVGVDSLTMLTDIAQSYILKANNRDAMEQRDWGAFLSNMTTVFSQLTGWPLVKVLTAHIKRDENQLTQVIEKLPLVPGQFGGKVSVLFDEVYFTNVDSSPVKSAVPGGTGKERDLKFWLQTVPDAVVRQAKSRKYNVPNGTPTDFNAVVKFIQAKVSK